MLYRAPSPSSAPRRLPGSVALRCAVAVAVLAGALGFGMIPGAPDAGAQTCGNTTVGTSTLAATPNVVSASSTSTVTVTGSRYLTGQYACGNNLFGGVYVFFGWVAPGGQWGPSHRSSTSSNGQFGISYSYPGEGGGGDTRDDGSGVVRLVSFTNGGTSGSETDFHMDANGNWSTTINVRGALYQWTDINTGTTNTVDCRAVQCGIFTIGAHGKSSASNEQFAPIAFSDGGPAPTVAPGGVSATPPAAGSGSSGTGSSGSAGSPSKSGSGSGSTASGSGSTGSTGSGGAGATGETTTTPAATDTTAPQTSTSEATVEGAEEEREIVAGKAAGVQEFGGGSSSGGLVIGLGALALVIAAATGAGWFVRRRRTAAPEGP